MRKTGYYTKRVVPPPGSNGGFLGSVARNVAVIKMVMLTLMLATISVVGYFLYKNTRGLPDFQETTPPRPGSFPPLGSASPNSPASTVDVPAVIGLVVSGVAVLTLMVYGFYYAVKQRDTTKSSAIGFS
jgi:hypothetical protein